MAPAASCQTTTHRSRRARRSGSSPVCAARRRWCSRSPGGPDSVALMRLAARWQRSLARGPRLLVVTVDHGLRRGGGARGARGQAAGHCARTAAPDPALARRQSRRPGLPAAAREARYRLLAQAARGVGASHVLTAHTRDDQAETLLMRPVARQRHRRAVGDGASDRSATASCWRARCSMSRSRSWSRP